MIKLIEQAQHLPDNHQPTIIQINIAQIQYHYQIIKCLFYFSIPTSFDHNFTDYYHILIILLPSCLHHCNPIVCLNRPFPGLINIDIMEVPLGYFVILFYIYYYSKYMSRIIQLEEQTQIQSPEALKYLIKSVFRSGAIYAHNIEQNGNQIVLYVKPSINTYRLTTIWVFSLASSVFKIQIAIYNQAQTDLLRAYTDRMKIQLAILIRIINEQVMPNFSFIVDHQSGALKLLYSCSWPQLYQMANNKQRIIILVNYLFGQLRRYNQLTIFIQPMFNPKQFPKENNPYATVNKFRHILKNTKNTRIQIQSCLGDLLRFKSVNQDMYRQKLQQVKNLYMMNVMNFQKSQIGLEEVDENKIQTEKFVNQLKQVRKNELGITTLRRDKNLFDTEKILFGLLKIQSQKDSKQKLLSQQGAHAMIYRKLFRYTVADTIYGGSMSRNHKQIQQRCKETKGQLTYKHCNKQVEASVNSFRNEIEAIKYMRDMQSPFIARYYLIMKQSWNEKDTIYMNSYKQNVFNLLKNNKAYCTKMRLQLSYKIAKGLCFLYSKQLIHRDFKPHNIVIDSNLVPKIIDFGSCVNHYGKQTFKVFDQRLLTTPGFHLQYNTQIPPGYQYIRQKFTKKAYDQHPLFDVYGFGRTLSFIFFNTFIPPHPDSLVTEPYYQLLQNIVFLINMCLRVDPDDRPGFGQLTAYLGALKQLIKNVVTQSQDENDNQL